MIRKILVTISVSCVLLLLGSAHIHTQNKIITYLPLGDSYTICTGVSSEESWPVILTRHLNEKGFRCELADNPARNGYTSKNLIDFELALVKKYKPGFVTILIGVNDWVRGVLKEDYHRNLVQILDEVQANMMAGGKIVLITIPDFGVTPEGMNYAGGRDISEGISEYNKIIRAEAAKRNIPVADIFSLSKQMGVDESLVSGDDLHPSAKEYAIWEKVILSTTLKLWQ